VLEEVMANYYRLRKRSLDSELNNLRFQLEALQENDEEGADERKQEIWQLTRRVQALADQRERLDRALARGPGAVQSLVGA
jgi:predicted  nucleic acid-binding Zn-ribbon protein